MIRRIGKQGTISLPKSERSAAGLHPGMAVDITAKGSSLVITPTYPHCFLCGSAREVQTVGGVNICCACAEKIVEVIK